MQIALNSEETQKLLNALGLTATLSLNQQQDCGTQEDVETEPQPDDEAAARAEKALEARARRAAKSADFFVTKSRARKLTHENHGGFQIRDAFSGFPVGGFWFELSAQDVIEFCTADTE